MVIGALVAALLAAGFWAGRVTAGRVEDVAAAPALRYVVTQGSVGRILRLNVTVSTPASPVASNHLRGVVTEVSDQDTFEAGDLLYAVGGRQVRLARGELPFYRDLGAGDSGADARQLRALLTDTGHLRARGTTLDGAAVDAIRRWQRDTGQPVTGQVKLGELVAVPRVPARLRLDTGALRPGAELTGSASVLSQVAGEPSFALEVADEVARGLEEGSAVVVTWQKHRWAAVTAGVSVTDSTAQVALTAADGGTVCGTECATLPADEVSYLPSEITVVPQQEGPAVPVAAISTDGSVASVLIQSDDDAAPEQRTVTVLGTQDGLCIVAGVTVGETVLIAEADAGGPPPPSSSATR